MAKESIIFNFKDGAKEVKVGDIIVEVDDCLPLNKKFTDFQITKIGNKLVTAQMRFGGLCGRDNQFYIETGRMKSNYPTKPTYSSSKAYHEYKNQQTIIATAASYARTATYEQAVEILKILGK
jgi:hypothetical protein